MSQSLVTRTIRSLWVFGIVLVVLYALVVYTLLPTFEDQVFERRLRLEMEHFVRNVEGPVGPETPLPSNQFMRSYLGVTSLPAEIRPHVEGLPDGTFELPQSLPRGYHVAVQTLPENDERLYLVYDVTNLEVHKGAWTPALAAMLIGLLAIVPLGMWWGRRLAGRVVAPIVDLAGAVESAPPGKLVEPGNRSTYPHEVEVLAEALRAAGERIEAFVERERRFTRNASHELRTPVTVIRGAVELLEPHLPPGNEKARQQLRRIGRSGRSMEEIIEAFLWLAREGDGEEAAGECRIEDLLPDLVDQYRHQLRDKPVEVLLDLDGELTVPAPEPVVAIALGNLIANAFYNTSRGSVTIAIDGDSVRIEDTGQGIDADRLATVTEPHVTTHPDSGHGLGLAIVEEVCDRFGWRLELESRPGEGTRTTLDFRR